MRAALLGAPLLLACLTTTAGCQQASPAAPRTPAARRLPELVRVVNTGNADTVRRFITASFGKTLLERFPMEEHVARMSEVYQRSGGLEVTRRSPSSRGRAGRTATGMLVLGKVIER